MNIFKLPDLGEGLPDAIIREWHVKEGDAVKKDQPIVSMETAKALVDVPAPFDAKIEKLFGNVNDTIETGKPLIGFEGESNEPEKKDTGTVVGKIETSEKIISNAQFSTTGTISHSSIKATPAIRALARKLHVDLSKIKFSGERITAADVEKAATQQSPAAATPIAKKWASENWEPLSNVKRAMVLSMTQSHSDIVPVTVIDDADIHAWQDKQDITVRVIRAIITACKTQPELNAWFDGSNMRMQKQEKINLGLALDMPHGLYVPVIKDIENCSDEQLRETIEKFKTQAQKKSIAQADLRDATIVLSNFGAIAGKYANPIILPPTVAIIGVGKISKTVVAEEDGTLAAHRVIPLSLTVDHRAITGGEAVRFLGAMISALSK